MQQDKQGKITEPYIYHCKKCDAARYFFRNLTKQELEVIALGSTLLCNKCSPLDDSKPSSLVDDQGEKDERESELVRVCQELSIETVSLRAELERLQHQAHLAIQRSFRRNNDFRHIIQKTTPRFSK